MTYVKHKQTGVSFDLPSGESCRDEGATGFTGDTLFIALTNRNYFPEWSSAGDTEYRAHG